MTPVAAVGRLFEAHLIVDDLDVSMAFYGDCLGLELAHVVARVNDTHQSRRNISIACGYF
jgi:predicted enzyme related to lactoylglutathione lyase